MIMRTDELSPTQLQTRDYLRIISNQFESLQSGHFVLLASGEMFTSTEYVKYINMALEEFKVKTFNTMNKEGLLVGIKNQQRIINTRSKKPTKKLHTRANYDRGGSFLITYRDSVEELIAMKLSTNERLVYYVLRDFVQYPTNCLIIKDKIPTIKELEPIVGLSNRSIIDALKGLEEKGLIKRKQSGHKKSIYFNPYYYASGKELEIEVLQMFALLECDDNKIQELLKENKIVDEEIVEFDDAEPDFSLED